MTKLFGMGGHPDLPRPHPSGETIPMKPNADLPTHLHEAAGRELFLAPVSPAHSLEVFHLRIHTLWKSACPLSYARVWLLALLYTAAQVLGVAAEHTWILPGQCTPPEFIARGFADTLVPQLGEQDQILFDLQGGRLLMEVSKVEPDSLTVGWLWMTTDRVKSGSQVFPTSAGPNLQIGAEDFPLKSLRFTHFFGRPDQRLVFFLDIGSPRYALVFRKSGTVGAGPSVGLPRAKSEGGDRYPADPRLLGTWISDAKKTMEMMPGSPDQESEVYRKMKAIFGKLKFTFSSTEMVIEVDGKIDRSAYRILASDEYSCVIEEMDGHPEIGKELRDILKRSRFNVIHFETPESYWVQSPSSGFAEYFRRSPQ